MNKSKKQNKTLHPTAGNALVCIRASIPAMDELDVRRISRMETLEHLQTDLCRRFGVPLSFPSRHLKLGVSRDFFAGGFPLNGLRHPPEDGTCGWFLWAGQELSSASDFFQPMHVEHLFERCPRVLPYLALPPGWRFLLADGHEDVWQDESLLVV